jgi:hypothetical protein
VRRCRTLPVVRSTFVALLARSSVRQLRRVVVGPTRLRTRSVTADVMIKIDDMRTEVNVPGTAAAAAAGAAAGDVKLQSRDRSVSGYAGQIGLESRPRSVRTRRSTSTGIETAATVETVGRATVRQRWRRRWRRRQGGLAATTCVVAVMEIYAPANCNCFSKLNTAADDDDEDVAVDPADGRRV